MEKERNSIRSFFSLLMVIASLFSVAFLQMEERRISYQVLTLNRELKKTISLRRNLEVSRLQALRPQKIENGLHSLSLNQQGDLNQIVHLSDRL